MYYVISKKNVGPHGNRNPQITIQNYPGRTNGSNMVVLNGWLGTTDDISAHAHGAFETLGIAKAFIADTWGPKKKFQFVMHSMTGTEWFDKNVAI